MDEAEAASIEMGDADTLASFVAATTKITGMDRIGATALVRERAAALAQISADITFRTLASLRSIVSSCGVLPGRKLLFLLSDGFALQFYSDDIVHKLRQVTDAAATAGIVIYTLDARGLVPNEPHTFITKQDGLNALASDTGGRFIHNTNALEGAIVKTMEETSRYYLLGWHVDPDKLRAGHYSSIRVSIPDRPDLKVRLRRDSINLSGLVADEKDRAQHTSTTAASGNGLVKALEYPWPISGLPTSLYCGFLYMPDKGAYALDISMQAEVERADAGDGGSGAGMRVEVMGVVADRNGKTVGGFKVSLDKPSDPPKDAGADNSEIYLQPFGFDPSRNLPGSRGRERPKDRPCRQRASMDRGTPARTWADRGEQCLSDSPSPGRRCRGRRPFSRHVRPESDQYRLPHRFQFASLLSGTDIQPFRCSSSPARDCLSGKPGSDPVASAEVESAESGENRSPVYRLLSANGRPDAGRVCSRDLRRSGRRESNRHTEASFLDSMTASAQGVR